MVVRSPLHTGVDAGRFFPFGNDADLPPDQRDEDARSACFEFEVPTETWVLGRPRVRLRLTCEVPRGQVIARLCDVAPDGSSTLVTRGVLNLSARHGRDRAVPWTPGATEDVTFELNGIGHAFPPGHRIRLAVSSAYWPWIWPQPESAAGFTLDPEGSALELPVREQELTDDIRFEEPEEAEPLGVNHPATLDEPRPERLVVRDVAKGEWRLEVDPGTAARACIPTGWSPPRTRWRRTRSTRPIRCPRAPSRSGRSGCTGRSSAGTRACGPGRRSRATKRTFLPQMRSSAPRVEK